MIIDRVQLAGLDAYFHDGADNINLAGQTFRSRNLGKGKQTEISGIELMIESDNDLTELFRRQADPLIEVRVMKEMFPTLFADPFRHRVHTIAGFDDFNSGNLENCRAMDVDGIPTIVSVGTETCLWTSPVYRLPEQVNLTAIAWELAATRKTAADSFTYTITVETLDINGNVIDSIEVASALDPTAPRKFENLDLTGVMLYRVIFKAGVNRDAALYEKHTTMIGESIGTPLLRAVNVLEPVSSTYEIYSLNELRSLSSDYHLFEHETGWLSGIFPQPLKRMLVTLDMSAILVQSDEEDVSNGIYEFIEINVPGGNFSNVEARIIGEVLIKVREQR